MKSEGFRYLSEALLFIQDELIVYGDFLKNLFDSNSKLILFSFWLLVILTGALTP